MITHYTLLEVQKRELEIDSTRFTVIKSPALIDFKSVRGFNNFYTWSNSFQMLQIIIYEGTTHIPALCGKHEALFQVSLIGGYSCNLCSGIFQSDADFSQITSLLLSSDIKPIYTPDNCLRFSQNKIINYKY